VVLSAVARASLPTAMTTSLHRPWRKSDFPSDKTLAPASFDATLTRYMESRP